MPPSWRLAGSGLCILGALVVSAVRPEQSAPPLGSFGELATRLVGHARAALNASVSTNVTFVDSWDQWENTDCGGTFMQQWEPGAMDLRNCEERCFKTKGCAAIAISENDACQFRRGPIGKPFPSKPGWKCHVPPPTLIAQRDALADTMLEDIKMTLSLAGKYYVGRLFFIWTCIFILAFGMGALLRLVSSGETQRRAVDSMEPEVAQHAPFDVTAGVVNEGDEPSAVELWLRKWWRTVLLVSFLIVCLVILIWQGLRMFSIYRDLALQSIEECIDPLVSELASTVMGLVPKDLKGLLFNRLEDFTLDCPIINPTVLEIAVEGLDGDVTMDGTPILTVFLPHRVVLEPLSTTGRIVIGFDWWHDTLVGTGQAALKHVIGGSDIPCDMAMEMKGAANGFKFQIDAVMNAACGSGDFLDPAVERMDEKALHCMTMAMRRMHKLNEVLLDYTKAWMSGQIMLPIFIVCSILITMYSVFVSVVGFQFASKLAGPSALDRAAMEREAERLNVVATKNDDGFAVTLDACGTGAYYCERSFGVMSGPSGFGGFACSASTGTPCASCKRLQLTQAINMRGKIYFDTAMGRLEVAAGDDLQFKVKQFVQKKGFPDLPIGELKENKSQSLVLMDMAEVLRIYSVRADVVMRQKLGKTSPDVQWSRELSRSRAECVMQELIKRGIARESLNVRVEDSDTGGIYIQMHIPEAQGASAMSVGQAQGFGPSNMQRPMFDTNGAQERVAEDRPVRIGDHLILSQNLQNSGFRQSATSEQQPGYRRSKLAK